MAKRVLCVVSLAAAVTLANAAPSLAATGSKAKAPEPPWAWLWVFPVCLVVFTLFALIWLTTKTNVNFWTNPPRIAGTWSFGDSWATNVTALGAVLSAIFSTSEAAKALFGAGRADAAIEFATIGAAIALAFIAASPLILLACDDDGGNHTAGGLLLAVSMLITGALGELVVDARAIAGFGIGYDIHVVWIGIAMLAIILLIYAARASKIAITAAAPAAAVPPTRNRAALL
jgi:hypothetical protein